MPFKPQAQQLLGKILQVLGPMLHFERRLPGNTQQSNPPLTFVNTNAG
jgi:hypothetical protein